MPDLNQTVDGFSMASKITSPSSSSSQWSAALLPASDSWSGSIVIVSILTFLFYNLLVMPVYNIYFHPLRKYPGPKIWAASALPWGFSWLSGYWHYKVFDLHKQYGKIIRVGPNEVSFSVPEAWDDIYGRAKASQRKENPKPTWYLDPNSKNLVSASIEEHGRMRRLLSTGFTGAAMVEQEPLIRTHVELFLQRLKEHGKDGSAVIDIYKWLAYCTFDIMGDLSFGQSFGCLRGTAFDPWISWVLANVKLAHTLVLCMRIPLFFLFLPIWPTWKLYRDAKRYDKNIRRVIDKRLNLTVDRSDLVQTMASKRGNLYLTPEEIYGNAALFVLGGAETTSNVMSSVIFMICKYPAEKDRILEELRTVFKQEDEIDLRSGSKLVYLNAVIQETMRMHPPGPNAMWRKTPPEGNWILGEWIPGNVVLSINHRVMYRSEHNFARPDEFLPERWLNNSEFAKDRGDAFHPFSHGPRTCIAMNLAYAEMRVILGRLLWNFDIEFAPQGAEWMDGLRAWLIWDKRPLPVYMKSRSST